MTGDNRLQPHDKTPANAAPGRERPAIEAVLWRMVLGGGEPVSLVRDLVTALRPRSRRDPEDALRTWRELPCQPVLSLMGRT